MTVITVLACAQKLLPAKAGLDVPLALAIIGLGIWIILAPWPVPGSPRRCDTSPAPRARPGHHDKKEGQKR